MKTRTINIYSFDELDEKAKEKARDWFRSCTGSEWADGTLSDADTVAGLLGITVDRGNDDRPRFYWSGFSSQGDGACFEGRYRYAKNSVKQVKDYAPVDNDLHSIAERLAKLQARYFYKLEAKTVQRGHYSHSGCMDVSVFHADDQYRDMGNAESELTGLLREFADWVYRQLENEFDYQNSDEYIDGAIAANEYEFLKSGEVA